MRFVLRFRVCIGTAEGVAWLACSPSPGAIDRGTPGAAGKRLSPERRKEGLSKAVSLPELRTVAIGSIFILAWWIHLRTEIAASYIKD